MKTKQMLEEADAAGVLSSQASHAKKFEAAATLGLASDHWKMTIAVCERLERIAVALEKRPLSLANEEIEAFDTWLEKFKRGGGIGGGKLVPLKLDCEPRTCEKCDWTDNYPIDKVEYPCLNKNNKCHYAVLAPF